MSRVRFFAVTVIGHSFYVHGLTASEPWDERRLEHQYEGDVELMTSSPSGQEIVRTVAELQRSLSVISTGQRDSNALGS